MDIVLFGYEGTLLSRGGLDMFCFVVVAFFHGSYPAHTNEHSRSSTVRLGVGQTRAQVGTNHKRPCGDGVEKHREICVGQNINNLRLPTCGHTSSEIQALASCSAARVQSINLVECNWIILGACADACFSDLRCDECIHLVV